MQPDKQNFPVYLIPVVHTQVASVVRDITCVYINVLGFSPSVVVWSETNV